MKRAPDIIIQLIHIEGPLKGEVREFPEPEITIGRNPSCHIAFPKDHLTISRQHARIVREGNRFKLIDESANGTLVNGKFITEHFLKDGDVIFITEEGPKISFLTRMPEAGETLAAKEKAGSAPAPHTPETTSDRPETPPDIHVQEMAVQFVVQYGPNLHSYKKMPVSVGRHKESDLVLPLETIYDRHAQFFYNDDGFWIKDLTGGDTIQINGEPIDGHRQMNLDDEIRLSAGGPTFRFIGSGRLVEVEGGTQPAAPDEVKSPASSELDRHPLNLKNKKRNPFTAFFKR